ncbi:MAG: four helix bundle protein [Bacteroidia bacterium]
MKSSELEQRLIAFAVDIIKVVDDTPSTKAGNHLAGQLVRSGTAPALNYGEALGAESKKDFIHKISVVLKELRESHITLQILLKSTLYLDRAFIETMIKEANELISIFVKTVVTSKRNL